MKYLCSVIAALLLTPISAQHAVENAKNNSQENWPVAHKNLPTTILSNDDAGAAFDLAVEGFAGVGGSEFPAVRFG